VGDCAKDICNLLLDLDVSARYELFHLFDHDVDLSSGLRGNHLSNASQLRKLYPKSFVPRWL